MPFRKTRHANAEAARIRMCAGFIEPANKFHQINRMLKGILRFVVGTAARRIAAECENVSDGVAGITGNDRGDFIFLVTHTSKMRNRIELGRCLNALDQVIREFAGRTTRAISQAAAAGSLTKCSTSCAIA